jgi:hypothetical protein
VVGVGGYQSGVLGFIVRRRYQATTSEDVEGLVFAVALDWSCSIRFSASTLAITTGFPWFSQSLHANARIVPGFMPRPLPSRSFPVHYSSVVLFDAIWSSYWQRRKITHKKHNVKVACQELCVNIRVTPLWRILIYGLYYNRLLWESYETYIRSVDKLCISDVGGKKVRLSLCLIS